jgi:hypothetical protein
MSWDRLVLTPGSVTKLFDIPGLATHARGLESTAEALYLRDHVLEQLTVQLRAPADAAAKQMSFDAADVNFLLLDLAEPGDAGGWRKLGDRAMRVLRRRGVDVRLGLTLSEVHGSRWGCRRKATPNSRQVKVFHCRGPTEGRVNLPGSPPRCCAAGMYPHLRPFRPASSLRYSVW